ncbi:hypothetical protein [Phenylobacterium sp.]|uniref:hypothetical protein n=1 Tax=Phenylobacterium sp. TaxID=1871053 RepID=UPI002FC7CF65
METEVSSAWAGATLIAVNAPARQANARAKGKYLIDCFLPIPTVCAAVSLRRYVEGCDDNAQVQRRATACATVAASKFNPCATDAQQSRNGLHTVAQQLHGELHFGAGVES